MPKLPLLVLPSPQPLSPGPVVKGAELREQVEFQVRIRDASYAMAANATSPYLGFPILRLGVPLALASPTPFAFFLASNCRSQSSL